MQSAYFFSKTPRIRTFQKIDPEISLIFLEFFHQTNCGFSRGYGHQSLLMVIPNEHFEWEPQRLLWCIFKCAQSKGLLLADRSCTPLFYQRHKTRCARAPRRREVTFHRVSSLYPVCLHSTSAIYTVFQCTPLTADLRATSRLLGALAHRVLGLWLKSGIQLRSARSRSFDCEHLKMHQSNRWGSHSKCSLGITISSDSTCNMAISSSKPTTVV